MESVTFNLHLNSKFDILPFNSSHYFVQLMAARAAQSKIKTKKTDHSGMAREHATIYQSAK